MRCLATALLILLSLSSCLAEEWVRVLDPMGVRVSFSPTRKVSEIETWLMRGHRSFVNLSFWGSRGPVGTLRIDGTDHGHGKKGWPILSIEPFIGEYRGGPMRTGFAGSNVLVRGGKPIRQKRSFFSRRRCPRTGIGVDSCGMLVVVVTTGATLDQFSRIMSEKGAVFAINVDGGGSTMFIENGETLWKSRRSAVPVILSW